MTTMTSRQFADALSTDPRTVRKYLRDSTPRDEQPGKGGRWELPGTKAEISKHRKAFVKWQKEQAEKAAQRAAEIAAKAADAAKESDEDLDEDTEVSTES